MQGIQSWPDAVVYLYALLYMLQTEYPKTMKYTFEFIQKVLLNVDGQKLRPKTLSLKNKL
ncbi:hypothetical protein LDENG_00169760 [Lucifuga dentata]|nr:hypothetical protein LDENG_00169760 [Lucifuga dentata]